MQLSSMTKSYVPVWHKQLLQDQITIITICLHQCCYLRAAIHSWAILLSNAYDDIIKWKHFPRNWPFGWWIHGFPANSPHKGQWCGALMFSLIWVWIDGWVNNREAGDLRCYLAHYDVAVMWSNEVHWNTLQCRFSGNALVIKHNIFKIKNIDILGWKVVFTWTNYLG